MSFGYEFPKNLEINGSLLSEYSLREGKNNEWCILYPNKGGTVGS